MNSNITDNVIFLLCLQENENVPRGIVNPVVLTSIKNVKSYIAAYVYNEIQNKKVLKIERKTTPFKFDRNSHVDVDIQKLYHDNSVKNTNIYLESKYNKELEKNDIKSYVENEQINDKYKYDYNVMRKFRNIYLPNLNMELAIAQLNLKSLDSSPRNHIMLNENVKRGYIFLTNNINNVYDESRDYVPSDDESDSKSIHYHLTCISECISDGESMISLIL